MTGKATISGVTHHVADILGREIHYVTSGESGAPILLVHGFPESWWAFHKIIPLLATSHRVIAVDLPGFGDSQVGPAASADVAETLAELVRHLGLGSVHLSGQDIGGVATFRLAATHPELVLSYTAIESALPGFGFEAFADVAKGGIWHVGFFAAPGIPDMLLKGHERAFLADYAFKLMNGTPGAITTADLDEFVRVYSREGGWLGSNEYYARLLVEGEEIRGLVANGRIAVPVLAVDGGSGPFTSGTMQQVGKDVTTATIGGVGHLVAIEAPERLAEAMLRFMAGVDEARGSNPAAA